jgi:multiple sugar transport system permease protein
MGMRRRLSIQTVLFALLVFGLVFVFTFPFLWMVLSSLKLQKDVTSYPPTLVFVPTLTNYADALSRSDLQAQIVNSVFVAFGALALGFVIGLPAAYVAARRGLRLLPLLVLVMRMIPAVIFMLPLFVLYQRLGLIDTHVGVIVSHVIITLPLTIWIMMGFFEEIPIEIEEQAVIDGCSAFGVFWRIALPLAKPGLIVTGILAFITSWNDFVFILVLGGPKTSTLPLAVLGFMGFEQLNFAGVAAVASILSLPVILLAALAQRWLVGGLTTGAIK